MYLVHDEIVLHFPRWSFELKWWLPFQCSAIYIFQKCSSQIRRHSVFFLGGVASTFLESLCASPPPPPTLSMLLLFPPGLFLKIFSLRWSKEGWKRNFFLLEKADLLFVSFSLFKTCRFETFLWFNRKKYPFPSLIFIFSIPNFVKHISTFLCCNAGITTFHMKNVYFRGTNQNCRF